MKRDAINERAMARVRKVLAANPTLSLARPTKVHGTVTALVGGLRRVDARPVSPIAEALPLVP